jgi:hypothetical protein
MVSTAARWHGGCLLVKAATSPGLEDGPMIGEILLLMAGTIPVALLAMVVTVRPAGRRCD